MNDWAPRKILAARYAVASALALFLPFALYVHKGIAVLFVLIAIVAWAARRRRSAWISAPSLVLIAFMLLAFTSTFWSPDTMESLSTAVSFIVTVVLGWSLVVYARDAGSDDVRLWERAIISGGILGYGLLLVELLSGGAIFSLLLHLVGKGLAANPFLVLKPGIALGAIYLWPWGLALLRWCSPYIACLSIAAVVLVLALFESGTALTAIVIGSLLAFYAALAGKRMISALAAIFSVMVLIAPLIARALPDPSQPGSNLAILSNSAIHRLNIWRAAAEFISEYPILGRGFDSARMVSRGQFAERVTFLPDVPERAFFVFTEKIPLHPHNLMLQVWLETGLLGASLLAIFAFVVFRRVAASTPGVRERFAFFGMMGSALTISTVGFGAWQSWWLAALFIMIAAMAALIMLRRSEPTP